MRTNFLKQNNYYHIYNYGAGESQIFLDENDYARFLFLILYFQSPTPINNISLTSSKFAHKGLFSISKDKLREVLETRYIELVAFSLKASRFDILIKNTEDYIGSVYMQRVLTSYSKYFNSKYKRKGHLFAGPFVSKDVKEDEVLQKSVELHYPESHLSSLRDYTIKNRWDGLLNTNLLLKHLKNNQKYTNLAPK